MNCMPRALRTEWKKKRPPVHQQIAVKINFKCLRILKENAESKQCFVFDVTEEAGSIFSTTSKIN